MKFKLIEMDATYSWKTGEVLLAMIIATAILVVLTLLWLKKNQGKKRLKQFIFPVLLYLFSPLIQKIIVGIQEYVFNSTHPSANLEIGFFAGPIDMLITFCAPPLATIVISYLLWLVYNQIRKHYREEE